MIPEHLHGCELKREILKLIQLHQEGPYWDLKREWYHDNGEDGSNKRSDKAKRDMLMDIICMANNLSFRDGYIIVGVEDETFEIIGVDDDGNRKTTECLTDFIRHQPFKEARYPKAYVEPIAVEDKTIDVIVVCSSTDVPYYLGKPSHEIPAGTIYARLDGANTPRNEGASYYETEKLWKHHFLLDATPLEIMHEELLNQSAWERSLPSAVKPSYLKRAPEFTLAIVDFDEDDQRRLRPEFYCYTQYNSRCSYCSLVGKYHQTVIIEKQGIWLDGGRYLTPTPQQGFLSASIRKDASNQHLGYSFFVIGSEEWLLQDFLFDSENGEQTAAKSRLMQVVLLYEPADERERFERYVSDNWERLEEEIEAQKDRWYVSPDKEKEPARSCFLGELERGAALVSLLERWRAENR